RRHRGDGARGAVVASERGDDVVAIKSAGVGGGARGGTGSELGLADAPVDRIPGGEHRVLVGAPHVAPAEARAQHLKAADQRVARYGLELAGVILAAEQAS